MPEERANYSHREDANITNPVCMFTPLAPNK